MGFLSSLNPFPFPIPILDPIKIITHPVDTVTGTVRGVTHTIEHPIESIEQTGERTYNIVTDPVGSATRVWESTTREGQIIANAVESTGLTIGKGMIDGAKAAGKLAEEGLEETGKGLVEIGKYTSEHVCDLVLGTALGALFAAWASDGQEEVEFGAFAVACAVAKELGEETEISFAADTLAKAIVDPIYFIPGVSDAVGHKDSFEAVLSFVISSTASQDPELVVGSAGQYLAGVIITTVTGIVCEGEVPAGGPKLWGGVQG